MAEALIAGLVTQLGLSASTVSVLSTLATTASIIGTLGAAFSGAAEAKDAAAQTEIEAGQSQLESSDRQLRMSEQLLQILGENDAGFAAGGTLLGQGASSSAARKAAKSASRELTIERQDQDTKRALYRMRAHGLRQKATSKILGGFTESIGTFAQSGIDSIRLGV